MLLPFRYIRSKKSLPPNTGTPGVDFPLWGEVMVGPESENYKISATYSADSSQPWHVFDKSFGTAWYPKDNFSAWLIVQSKKGPKKLNKITLYHDESVLHTGYLPQWVSVSVSNTGGADSNWVSHYDNWKLTWTKSGSIWKSEIPMWGLEYPFFRLRGTPQNHPYVWYGKIVFE